ncbi:MAG TPA: hypothetical protein VFX98_06340, partial [Longimicrobiaceae bacterium]|nr:hypothetical protein [Longimicrobiaceae bacterium]
MIALMRQFRVYADTSAIGGCLDPEFSESSRRLFQQFHSGDRILVVSDLTLLELQWAPAEVRAVVDDLPSEHREQVDFTREAADLAEHYIRAGVIGAAMRTDAQHIATATVHRVDVLVSWNFKHIVNLPRIRGYNSVNLREGY